jgi:hypothetical protein
VPLIARSSSTSARKQLLERMPQCCAVTGRFGPSLRALQDVRPSPPWATAFGAP